MTQGLDPDSANTGSPGLLARLTRSIATAKMALAAVFMVLMMLHVAADVGLKLALNQPITGTLETVSYYYMISIVFLPLAFVEMRNEHVAVDVFFQMFPSALKVAVYVLGGLISVGYYGLFTYQTTIDALKATAELETVMGNFLFYVWPSRWALPLGGGALCLAILSNMAEACITGAVPKSQSDEDVVT